MKTSHLAIISLLLFVTISGISMIYAQTTYDAVGSNATNKLTNSSASYLDVKLYSAELVHSGDNITETNVYYITVEPKSTGQLTIDIFKNNKFIRTDTLSNRDIVSSATGESEYYYKLTISGKKDQDVYRLEFKYDGQNVEKIVPITSPSIGIIPNTESNLLPSPLKQFKSGITANEIQCKEGLQLVIKSSNGFPACVKPSSISRLVEIGWGTKTIKVQNTDFAISYSITEGELISATANFDTHSLVISVQRTSNGDLTVKLPRGLIDSVNNLRDEVFTVLVNGEKVDYKEQKTQDYRTLTFQLKSGTTQVQIIPYCPPMGCGG